MSNRINNKLIKIDFYWLSFNCERKLRDSRCFRSKLDYAEWLSDVSNHIEIIQIG